MSSAETEGVPGAKPGDVLAGKYRVDRVLGAGGMGVVVAATHLQLEDRVAIKFLLPDAAKSKDVVSRFEREAKAARKITSEHVAKVSDVGQLDNGAPYMVMEFLEGHDLADLIEKHGPQPIQAAVEYVLQACEALAEAHAAGIVHRDLKPANLFLTSRADGSPCIKVLDFGISKVLNSVSMPGMTRTTAVMGSPLYMSPEQMKSSKDVDHRTDIWSLGAILYELLSGDPPFIADTMPQLCLMIMQEPLAPLTTLRQDIPPHLEAVIRKCQEKDPNHRFQNIAELAAALTPFATGRARMSAERVANVLRASMSRGGSMTPAVPSVQPGMAPGPQPMPPYGVTNPGAPYGAPQGPYVAQAATGGNFGAPPGAQYGATVMGAPNMQGMPGPGMTVHGHHGPPMGASTAASWEGMSGGAKKKGSAGVILGVVAGLMLLIGIGVAALALAGGSKDTTTAAAPIPLPQPTTSTDVKPAETAPAASTEAPAATSAATLVATAPAVTAPVGSKPGKTGKTAATPSASATATSAPTGHTSRPGLDDDRK